ncbi:MAG: cobalamin biosynthesis protein [Clostridia bacterium]|nr:cobalamin biosynthesis protein [Clostridia bacterium]
MKIAAIAFTDRGQAWEEKLGFAVSRGIPVREWTAANFSAADALLFIGAAGIAVRAVAPYIKDKTRDPAVLVMDEAGRFVVPVLSGHIGGGNRLAEELARRTGAQPVLTTATDVRGLPAIDTWAAEQGHAIENPEAIRAFAAAQLAGEHVGVAVTERTLEPPFPVTLYVRPRTLILGTGCKRGIGAGDYERFALEFLRYCGVSLLSVRALATIDRKKDEAALHAFCGKYRLPLFTYTAEALAAVPGVFAGSDFVRETVGVDNVCERAAAAAGAVLLQGKTAYEGCTFALAREKDGEEEGC